MEKGYAAHVRFPDTSSQYKDTLDIEMEAHSPVSGIFDVRNKNNL
jgi:hypothetical protein